MDDSLCCTLPAFCAYKIFSTYKIIWKILSSTLLDQKLGPPEISNFKKCLILIVKYMKAQMLRICLADLKVVCEVFPSIHLWFFSVSGKHLQSHMEISGRSEGRFLCPEWQKEQNHICTLRTFGICNIVQ